MVLCRILKVVQKVVPVCVIVEDGTAIDSSSNDMVAQIRRENSWWVSHRAELLCLESSATSDLRRSFQKTGLFSIMTVFRAALSATASIAAPGRDCSPREAAGV